MVGVREVRMGTPASNREKALIKEVIREMLPEIAKALREELEKPTGEKEERHAPCFAVPKGIRGR